MPGPVVLRPIRLVIAPLLETGTVAKPILPLTLGAICLLAITLRALALSPVAALGLAIVSIAALAPVVEALLAVELAILALPLAAILEALVAITETALIVVVALGAVLLPLVGPLSLGPLGRLFCRKTSDYRLFAMPEIVAATVVIGIIVVDGVASQPHAGVDIATGGASGDFAALLHLLLAVGEDDAIVMLCVLEIVLCQHRVAGRLRVTGKRDVFLGNVGGRATHLHIGTVGLETPRQRVLALAVVITIVVIARVSAIVVMATTATTMLLSLPHGLPFSR